MTNVSPLIQVRAVELPLDAPLPWDLVDARGILVLKEGALLTGEAQVERLLERRVCRARTAADDTPTPARTPLLSVFEELTLVRAALQDCLYGIAGGGGTTAIDSLLRLAERMRYLARMHPDAVIGALQLDSQASYTDLHPVLVAVIGELIARRLGVDEQQRNSLCLAALTSNLGMLSLQDTLSRQSAALDETQRRAVRDHPEQGFEMLRAIGVTDPLWLSIVLNHHERGDGSGYPHARRDPYVDQLSSLVALADNYAAMVLPRAYRNGMHAQQAMREIFVQRRIRVAGELVQQFVKELGVYPPGAFVVMKNGDHGIVIKRGHRTASAPVVSCFANVHHVRFDAPLIRDTGEGGGHAIAAIAAPQALALPLSTIWGMGR